MFSVLLHFSLAVDMCYWGLPGETKCDKQMIIVNSTEDFYDNLGKISNTLVLYNTESNPFAINITRIGSQSLSVVSDKNFVKLIEFRNNFKSTFWFENTVLTLDTEDDISEVNFHELYLENVTILTKKTLNLTVSKRLSTNFECLFAFDNVKSGLIYFMSLYDDIRINSSKKVTITQQTSTVYHQIITVFSSTTNLFVYATSVVLSWPEFGSNISFLFPEKTFLQINDAMKSTMNLFFLSTKSNNLNMEINIKDDATLNIVETTDEYTSRPLFFINAYGGFINIMNVTTNVPARVTCESKDVVIRSNKQFYIHQLIVSAVRLTIDTTYEICKVRTLSISSSGLIQAPRNTTLYCVNFEIDNSIKAFGANIHAIVEDQVTVDGGVSHADGLFLMNETTIYQNIDFNTNNTIYIKNITKTNWPLVAVFKTRILTPPPEEVVQEHLNQRFYGICSDTIDCSNLTYKVQNQPPDMFRFIATCERVNNYNCTALYYNRSPRVYQPRICYKANDKLNYECDKEAFVVTEENITEWYKIVYDVTDLVTFEVVGSPQTPISFEKIDHKVKISVVTEKNCTQQSSINITSSKESDKNVQSFIVNNITAKFIKTDNDVLGIKAISIINSGLIDQSIYSDFNCSSTEVTCELSTLLSVDIHAWNGVTLSIKVPNLSIIIQEDKTLFNNKEILNKQLQNVHVMLEDVSALFFNTTCDYSNIYPLHIYIGNSDLSLFIEKGFNLYNYSKIFHLHCHQKSINIRSESSFFPLMLHNTAKILFIKTPEHIHICEQEIASPSIVDIYTTSDAGQIIFDTISIHADFSLYYAGAPSRTRVTILSVFIDDNIQVRLSKLEIQGFIQIPAHTKLFASDVNFVKTSMRISIEHKGIVGSIIQTTKLFKASIPESVTVASSSINETFNVTEPIIKAETKDDASSWMSVIHFDPDIIVVNNNTFKPKAIQESTKICVIYEPVNAEDKSRKNTMLLSIIIPTSVVLVVAIVTIFLVCFVFKKRKTKDFSQILSGNDTLVSIT